MHHGCLGVPSGVCAKISPLGFGKRQIKKYKKKIKKKEKKKKNREKEKKKNK